MAFITTERMNSILSHRKLIDHFEATIATASRSLAAPHRQSHAVSATSSLLVMPSWSESPALPYIGVKLVTYFPENSGVGLPGVQGSYVLFSSRTGQALASMDGTELTLFRTSCVSGLASRLLARQDSKVLTMIGAGSLAPHLIRAHISAVPSLERVVIWNRTIDKATKLAEELGRTPGHEKIRFESNPCLEEAVGAGDVVSCATNSETPLVHGIRLKPGAHLDLVGSFKPTMRECDDEALRIGRVFVDNEAALIEAGELVGAFERGVIRERDLCGTLLELVNGEKVGRRNSEEITVFKSVGSALVDILAAQLVYETFCRAE